MSQHPEDKSKIRVGITIGDMNGVGPEVIIKSFSDPRMLQLCTPVVYGSSKVISFYRKVLNDKDFNFNTIKSASEIKNRKVNLINCWNEEIKIEPGSANPIGGKYAFLSLQQACEDLSKNLIDALVTAPVDKKTMQQEGFRFPGHTEYLAQQFETKDYLMMLVSDNLRVATVTGHVPLSEVSALITTESISSKIAIMNMSLKRDFGIRKPRIAVLGLNPHSGDNGLLGKEEIEIIEPAIKSSFEQNILVYGPYAADGFFGSNKYHSFDGIVAMYHDQGLVPFKSIEFDSGVNFTAGLPVVRTSPDHGTGYDIAGKGVASENSLRAAIYAASDIIKKRSEFDLLSNNQLKYSKLKHDR